MAGITLPRWVLARFSSSHALAKEIALLPIRYARTESDGSSLVELTSNRRFYGYAAPGGHAACYRLLPAALRRRLPEACTTTAADIVFRYVYPHADATAGPPYPTTQRKAFHRQHRDTVEDLITVSEDQRRALREHFSIRPGDYVVDVGAFIGYGALRLSELVGPSGRILSIEAHPDNQELFRKNIDNNGITNVQLRTCGVWDKPGSLTLNCTRRQANSLVADIVPTSDQFEVPTDTIDNLVAQAEWKRVSLVSITINAAEIEAVRGMQRILRQYRPRLTVAGWYHRGGRPVYEQIVPLLHDMGYETIVGPVGRIYAWPC